MESSGSHCFVVHARKLVFYFTCVTEPFAYSGLRRISIKTIFLSNGPAKLYKESLVQILILMIPYKNSRMLKNIVIQILSFTSPRSFIFPIHAKKSKKKSSQNVCEIVSNSLCHCIFESTATGHQRQKLSNSTNRFGKLLPSLIFILMCT